MKRYDQLIRARKWTLDGLRRELADLEGMQADIDAKIESLDRQLVEEQMLASRVDLLGDFGAYARAVQQRRRALEASLAEIGHRIAEKHAQVSEAFKDMKTIEIASERMQARAKAQRQRREQAEMDDIAITRHVRGAQ